MARILIVEDDPSSREAMELILEQAGHRNLVARSGPAALDILRHEAPDLVLLDIAMPGMSGLEVLAVLRRSRHRRLPVLMTTASSAREHVDEALRLGANGYLLKPFLPEGLKARVAAVLTAAGYEAPVDCAVYVSQDDRARFRR
jgi:DNA-binding response OmpR family regulator